MGEALPTWTPRRARCAGGTLSFRPRTRTGPRSVTKYERRRAQKRPNGREIPPERMFCAVRAYKERLSTLERARVFGPLNALSLSVCRKGVRLQVELLEKKKGADGMAAWKLTARRVPLRGARRARTHGRRRERRANGKQTDARAATCCG